MKSAQRKLTLGLKAASCKREAGDTNLSLTVSDMTRNSLTCRSTTSEAYMFSHILILSGQPHSDGHAIGLFQILAISAGASLSWSMVICD